MCIDFDGHHSGGSSFIYVSNILILLYKKKPGKESHYIVSRPELGSDPPIGRTGNRGVTHVPSLHQLLSTCNMSCMKNNLQNKDICFICGQPSDIN